MLRRGLTTLDVLMIILVVLLVVLIFLPREPAGRRMAKQTVCAANLKGIGHGFHAYSVSNNDMFPIAAHVPAVEEGIGQVRYAPGKIGLHRGRADAPDLGETTVDDAEMSTTRNLWILIRAGASAPRSFICPSSRDEPNDEDSPQVLWDFRKHSEVSYGYQVPYGKRGRPNADMDEDMALAADKGALGAALEAGMSPPGLAMPKDAAMPDDWRRWNSPNHGGEGQNVMYTDGHVVFATTPLAGVKSDNIYTRWQTPDGGTDAVLGPRIHGTPPTGIETPFGDTDSLIYP